jgi:hypothetical protein
MWQHFKGRAWRMLDKPIHFLGDDLPKQNPWQDDRLGFAAFAKRISKVIIHLRAPNGYVIGLHGQWGSGKSTTINFILAYLKKHNGEHENDQVVHIDFRPWIVSGHQDLVAAFFKILSERLGPKDNRWKRTYKRFLGFMSGTSDNLVDAAATVALSVDPSIGVASGIVGNLAKKPINELLQGFLDNPSLQKSYEDLREQLGRSGLRFLVTIDDIDRLEDQEVKSIMQMVKSIGQLPNVIYLLAYDREIVSQALDRGVDRVGPRFAEKIVQQEIELPKPSKASLLTILDQETSFLVGSSDDSMRWHYIVSEGVQRWIRSPRDVVRLSNAVKFTWPALEGEIDPQDLLAIEGLRLFDEGAFNWIRDNRDFLFLEGRFRFASDEEKKAAVDRLRKRIPVYLQPQVFDVLSVLFPQAAKWFEGRGSVSGEAYVEIQKRRGIGCEDGYDAYFRMHPSADAIPKVVVNELIARLDDADRIEAIIRSYLGKKNSRGELMIAKLIDELRVQFQASHPARPTQALLDALFSVGEEIMGIDDRDIFQLPPRAQISFLIRDMLELWGPEDAGDRLIEAFEKGTSPAFLASVYVDRGRERGVFQSDSTSRPLIVEADFNEIGEILLDKIQSAANDEKLGDAPYFFDIARSWAKLDNPESPKRWLTEGMMKSVGFMFKVGTGLVSYSLGTPERRYTMRDNPDPELYDVGVLVKAGKKHLQRTDLSKDQRNLISEIVRGSERLLHGQSSEQTNDDDE